MSRRFAAIGVLMSVGLSVLPAKADEKPNQIKQVTFLGAKHIKEEDLLNLTGVRPGMFLNPKLNQKGCQKILDKYGEMGRSFASCALVKGGDPNDTEVVYQITEGPKVKVRDIRFTGNAFVSSARLATRIKSLPNWFHVLGGNYNSKMAEADTHELEKYFKKFGYQDVKVSLETQRSADGGSVTLIFHIHEGERHSIQASPQTNSQNTISPEQPPARIGQIILTGNKRISSDSILDHLALCPGQILTYPDLKKAEKRLAELGLFVADPSTGVHPTITVLDSGSDSVYKDILITVKEKKTKRTSDSSK
ncbi:MAG TPA: POTRA domain-containing protein [Gemmataceae bacterium]|jgi:outer membrane protein assembly factor BamA